MRVLVTGGRNYRDTAAIDRELSSLHRKARHDCMRVIQGGADGADRLAREWCHRNFVTYLNFPADWKTHGKAAGPLRNARMIAEGKPDIVIAFPGGRGTADCVRKARAAGIPVVEVRPPETNPETERAA